MSIETATLVRKAEFRQAVLQHSTKLSRALAVHASANPGRKMVCPWKNPNISVQPFYEFDLHGRTRARNVISGRDHEVLGAKIRSKNTAE